MALHELQRFAQITTDMRRKVLLNAAQQQSVSGDHHESSARLGESLRKKIYRSQPSHVDSIHGAADLHLMKNPLEGVGHRERSLSKLTTGEKIEIVHSAIVGREHHKDIALRMKVSPSLVTRLSLKARRDPQFIQNINAKEVLKSAQVAKVKTAAAKLLN